MKTPFIQFLVVLPIVGSSLLVAKTPVVPKARHGLYVASVTDEKALVATNRAKAQVVATKPYLVPAPPPPIEVGVMTGMSFSYASGDPDRPGNTRNAGSFAITFERALNQTFSVGTELGYVQRGVHTQLYSFGGIDVAGDVKLDYLEVPLLIKAKFPVGRQVKFFGAFGPNFALALQRQIDIAGMVQLDMADKYYGYDLGALFGFGLDYAITRDMTVTSTLRYTYGICDIDKTEAVYKTRGIQLLLGVRFGL